MVMMASRLMITKFGNPIFGHPNGKSLCTWNPLYLLLSSSYPQKNKGKKREKIDSNSPFYKLNRVNVFEK